MTDRESTQRPNSAIPPRPPAPRDEPLLYSDPVAEQHAHDSSSLAPSRADEPRRALHSPTMWALFILTLAALAGLVFMTLRLHPVDSGRVQGPADEAAPNAPRDYKAPRATGPDNR